MTVIGSSTGSASHIRKASPTAIIGASGSGKSTFLRLLNRFTPTIGEEVRGARPMLTDVEVNQLLERVALPDMPTGSRDDDPVGRRTTTRGIGALPGGRARRPAPRRAHQRPGRSVGHTVVLVSHDLERVVDLADTVLVLDHGRLVERGDPGDVRYLS